MCLVRLNNIGQFVRGDVDSPAIGPHGAAGYRGRP